METDRRLILQTAQKLKCDGKGIQTEGGGASRVAC